MRVLIYQSGCVGVEERLYSADLTLLLCAVMGRKVHPLLLCFSGTRRCRGPLCVI